MHFVTMHLFPFWNDLKVAPPRSLRLVICLYSDGGWHCSSLLSPSMEFPAPLLVASLLLSCTGEELWNVSAGCSFRGQDWQKPAADDMAVVFSKGSGSGAPVQVWACASMSDNEGGMETKEGKVLSCFGKLYWKENML